MLFETEASRVVLMRCNPTWLKTVTTGIFDSGKQKNLHIGLSVPTPDDPRTHNRRSQLEL